MEQSNSSLSHAGKDADAEKSPPNTVQNGLEQPKAPPPAPPDGGLQAWLVCLGTFCGYVATFGWLTCIGVFQDYYQQNFLSSYSPSAVAWIPSTQAFMIFGGGLIFGKVFDSYGPRWPMLIGTFLQVFGLMMTSLSTKYYQIFLSQAIVSAVGASIIWPSFAASLLTWFQKKRSTAFGIATTGSSIGGVVFPIMVYRLIPQVGFPWTMRIVAFLLLALLGVTNLTVKSMLEHSPTPFTAKEYIVQLKDANFAVTVLGSAIFSFGLFVPFNFIILQAEHKGMSNHLAQYLVSILNAASLPGRVLPGFLADKFGRFHVLILTTMFSGILTLALWIPASSNATIITFTASYGFFSGAYVSLGPSVVAQISEIAQIGLRNGLLYFFVGIAVLAGNPIAGALIDSDNGNYTKLQIFAGVMMIAGASLLLCARIMVAGWKWKVT